MTTFKNIKWLSRDYECTNVVACVADAAPGQNWAPCEDEILNTLTPLWTESGVQYYGYL